MKILAHRYLPPGYRVSLYVDGNMEIRGDVRELCYRGLQCANAAFYDHARNVGDSRDCAYEEAEALYDLERLGKKKEDAEVIRAQMTAYRDEGYPQHAGLVTGMVVARRHHEPDVVRAMESWWQEVASRSRRDQLSFNYVAWKEGFRFSYLDGDSRDNAYVFRRSHRISKWRHLRALGQRLLSRGRAFAAVHPAIR
jgi:hypothetical protein